MLNTIRQAFIAKETDEGASAVEYGLLVAAIAAVIVIVVFAVGGYVEGAFNDTCDGLAAGGGTTTGGNCP